MKSSFVHRLEGKLALQSRPMFRGDVFRRQVSTSRVGPGFRVRQSARHSRVRRWSCCRGRRHWIGRRRILEEQRQVAIIEKQLERLLKRRFSGLGTNLLERYRMRCNSLFIFLKREDVPADNNACESALRPSVIHRKVMGSFRSDWGAHSYAALSTVLNTAKRNRESAFQKLVQLMSAPVLPFLLQPTSFTA